jgi:hypothetical protein
MTTFQLNKFCSPAQVYLILAGLGLVFMIFNDFRLGTLILHFIFVILFAYILDYLCSIKLTAISWILVFLPWLFLFSTFFLALDVGQDQGNIIETFPNIGSAFSWCDNNKNHKNYKQICSDAGGGTTGKAKSSKDKAAAYVDWCKDNTTHQDYDSLCNNLQFKRIKKCYTDPLDPQCGKIEVVTNNVAARLPVGNRYAGRISKLKKTYLFTNGQQHYKNVKSIHDLLDKKSTKLDRIGAEKYLRTILGSFRLNLNRWKVCANPFCSGSSDQNNPAVQNTINLQAARSLAAKVLDKYFRKFETRYEKDKNGRNILNTKRRFNTTFTEIPGSTLKTERDEFRRLKVVRDKYGFPESDSIKENIQKELAKYARSSIDGGINSPFVKEWDKNIKSAMAKRT